MWTVRKRSVLIGSCGIALFLFTVPENVGAATMFGALSNFDVFNDSGHDAHGFQIQLDGVSVADVLYEFQSPNIRYSAPSLIPIAGGVLVRYLSPYTGGAWAQTTPIASVPITPTMGHQCWTGGSANYANSGCEHFGLSLAVNPTNTTYTWIIEGSTPGTWALSGSNVSIPAPVWTIPPAGPPVIHAVIPAPPPPVPALFGPAQYMKVYYTENSAAVGLNQLVPDDPAVPSDSETEMEWFLLQKGLNDELDSQQEAGAGADSVVRRYEFYKYVGPYDSDGQALCEDPTVAGCENSLGGYIGAQIAAVNLAPNPPNPNPVPEPSTLVLVGGVTAFAAFVRCRHA